MAGCLNSDDMLKPHWELITKGFNVDHWYAGRGTAVERTGGMEAPWRNKLRLGHRYFRFADSTRTDDERLSGGWWLEYEQLMKLVNWCSFIGMTLSQVARHHLAVPWEWNRADMMVSGWLVQPMETFEGRGRPAQTGQGYKGQNAVDNGTTYAGDRDVLQLYIPNMKKYHSLCLGSVTIEPVRAFAAAYRHLTRV
jgi:hypothetical protein